DGVTRAAALTLPQVNEPRADRPRARFQDRRRASCGPSGPSGAGGPDRATAPAQPARRNRLPQPRPVQPRPVQPRPWTKSQEKLALLYNEQGRRPEEIAQKLGLSPYLVTQIILSSRNRGKL